MTLIVGIRCSDGVVIGADSAATFGTLGQETIAQPTYNKVEVVDRRALIAVSGPVGLGQRLTGEFTEALQDNKRLRGASWRVMTELRQAFAPHIEMEFQAARAAAPLIGNAAAQSVLSHTLAAMVVNSAPTLFQFDQQGAPEEATEQLPFICAGSGQPLADPFLAFVKELFWKQGSLPTFGDATFAALWTVSQSISVAPGHIAKPEWIYGLRGDGHKYVAEQLEEAELQEHRQAIEDARDALIRFREFKAPGAAATPPPE